MNQEELVERFMDNLRADKKSKSTVDTYCYVVNRFLSFVEKAPDEVTIEDIQRYKLELVDLKPATVSLHLSSIKSFLEMYGNYAIERVKRPTITRINPIPLTQEEIDRMLEVANNPVYHAVIATLFYTGMRVGSLLKLRFNDILWDEDRVVLREAKRGKTYTVLMPNQAMDAIKTYQQFRVEPKYTKDTDVVFISSRSRKPYTVEGISYMVKATAVRAGITKRVYPHLLRHTHGTIARKRGIALDTIAHQMGHESIATTQLYAQLADEIYQREYQAFFEPEGVRNPSPQPPTLPKEVDKAEVDKAYR